MCVDDRTVKGLFLSVFYAAAVQWHHIQMEMLYYQILHPLNQAELPAMLDKYRIGEHPLDFKDDSSQSVNF
jgi:hypothetical protein